MKKILIKLSKAVWLQVIAATCFLFFLSVAVGNSLEHVSGTEMQQVSDYSDESFNESGAFGDWEEFSDFYEESQQIVPDTSSAVSFFEVSEELSSEPSSQVSSEISSSEVSSSQPGITVTPDVSSAPQESSSLPESSSEPESSFEPAESDSPIDAPSFTTSELETPVTSE